MKSMPGGVSEVSGAENRQEFQAIAQYTVDKLNSDKVRFRRWMNIFSLPVSRDSLTLLPPLLCAVGLGQRRWLEGMMQSADMSL